MKTYFILFSLLISLSTQAQKYFTKNGQTHFKASVEAFEPVEAENTSTTVVLNTTNGQMAALIFVKAFHFDIALMEEHFNENYMDSDQYPKATFKGQIENFNLKDLKKEAKVYKLTGTLTIRGKEKQINSEIQVSKKDNKIELNSLVSVKPQEFGIEIPGIVKEKIAKNILIDSHYVLEKKK